MRALALCGWAAGASSIAMMHEESIEVELIHGPVVCVEAPLKPGGGGECIFLGRTRAEQHDEYGELRLLRYEAYDEMALRLIRDLAREARDEHGALFVRVHHGVGDVPVGQASVLVQVICPHREAAFRACRMIIDRLKLEAPIWKCEVWERGQTWSGEDESRRALHAQGDQR